MKWRFIKNRYIENRWCSQLVADYLGCTFFHSYAANYLSTLNNVRNADLIKQNIIFFLLILLLKKLTPSCVLIKLYLY